MSAHNATDHNMKINILILLLLSASSEALPTVMVSKVSNNSLPSAMVRFEPVLKYVVQFGCSRGGLQYTKGSQDDCQWHAMCSRITAYIHSRSRVHWISIPTRPFCINCTTCPAHPNETMVSFHNMASCVNIYPTQPQLSINWFDRQHCIQLTKTKNFHLLSFIFLFCSDILSTFKVAFCNISMV